MNVSLMFIFSGNFYFETGLLWRSLRLTASSDDTLLDLHNSSDDTQPRSIIAN